MQVPQPSLLLALSSPSVACNLAAFTPEERRRHDADTQALLARVAGVTELDDGFVFRFREATARPEPDLSALLAAWTRDESRCCPFFVFRIDGIEEGKPALTITGPPGSKEILRAPLASHT